MHLAKYLWAWLRRQPQDERTVATNKHSLGVRIARQQRTLFGWREIPL